MGQHCLLKFKLKTIKMKKSKNSNQIQGGQVLDGGSKQLQLPLLVGKHQTPRGPLMETSTGQLGQHRSQRRLTQSILSAFRCHPVLFTFTMSQGEGSSGRERCPEKARSSTPCLPVTQRTFSPTGVNLPLLFLLLVSQRSTLWWSR